MAAKVREGPAVGSSLNQKNHFHTRTVSPEKSVAMRQKRIGGGLHFELESYFYPRPVNPKKNIVTLLLSTATHFS